MVFLEFLKDVKLLVFKIFLHNSLKKKKKTFAKEQRITMLLMFVLIMVNSILLVLIGYIK